jgi:prokaryotic ubiquitin-like protein Pup
LMADQTRKPKPKKDEEEAKASEEATTESTTEDIDELLDEIDEVLEVNSEDFVRGFVQKGGETIIAIGLLTGQQQGFRWSSLLAVGIVYIGYRLRHKLWINQR